MAWTFTIAPPALLPCRSKNLSSHLPKLPSPTLAGKQRRPIGVVKAVQEGSEPSTGSIVKYLKNAWSSPEDLFALAGIGFGAIAAFWASVNLVEAIDKLPIAPTVFEIIGILFSWWFIYRNLLFKPDREAFLENIKRSVSRILGQ